MQVDLPQSTHQSTQQEERDDFRALLDLVERAWGNRTRLSTGSMNDIRISSDIERIVVGGTSYTLSDCRRIAWFERAGRGYNPDILYVTEAIDSQGHAYQLRLRRFTGEPMTAFRLIKATRLYGQQVYRMFQRTGVPYRD